MGVFHEGADELVGVIAGTARGLQDKKNKVDVKVTIKLDLLGSLGHVPRDLQSCHRFGFVLAERQVEQKCNRESTDPLPAMHLDDLTLWHTESSNRKKMLLYEHVHSRPIVCPWLVLHKKFFTYMYCRAAVANLRATYICCRTVFKHIAGGLQEQLHPHL